MSQDSTKAIFQLLDYRVYIQNWVESRPRGEYRKIAEALGMHTTLISQIMAQKKSLTEEQALRISQYMHLNPLETDYFLKLVQIERAGTHELKELFKRQLLQLRESAQEIRNQIPSAKKLSEEDRALFYSSWQYSAVRIFTSIPDYQTEEALARELELPLSRVQELLHFLIAKGLCERSGKKYQRTQKNTHVESGHPLSTRHHQNWRTKSAELLEKMTATDLAFTAPVSIAKKDIPKVRSLLLDTVASIAKIIEQSPPEEAVYLGIDWLHL